MADWRARLGADLPFLVVQLASYGLPSRVPAESAWARVREAQRLAVAGDPKAGLAVTIDIGDVHDIHPANKRELGRRLARVARRVVYGESLAPSGPQPLRARLEADGLVVEFADVEGELSEKGVGESGRFELCGAEPGSCRCANARGDGSRVFLTEAGLGTVERVRFCWADNPSCALFDGSGLPVGPFELRVE